MRTRTKLQDGELGLEPDGIPNPDAAAEARAELDDINPPGTFIPAGRLAACVSAEGVPRLLRDRAGNLRAACSARRAVRGRAASPNRPPPRRNRGCRRPGFRWAARRIDIRSGSAGAGTPGPLETAADP